jgi:orotate phosphoribosyltransferase
LNYRSVADLNRCIVAQQHRLPRDIDLVVGIPRNGLLAANLIALHLNLPMADLDGYLAGRLVGGGVRLQTNDIPQDIGSLKALVVDDSIHSGQALNEAKERINAAGLEENVVYACVFADPNATDKVDFYFDTCPMPRVFEWNIMHQIHLERSCVDIDGVLCRDPREEENDDGQRYEQFVATVESLVVPSVPVGWLVTCRLEKYRKSTVEWLARQGIRYRHLVMMNHPDKASRVASGGHASFKASVYRRVDAVLFIESSMKQAADIAQLTGRDVFCMETREMINPSFLARSRRLVREPSAWPKPDLGRLVSRVRYLLKVRTRLRKGIARITGK